MGSLTFYFDRCFGKRLPETLMRAQPPFAVQYHHDPKGRFRFEQRTPDDEWLAKVGGQGWIVFSHDSRFHEQPPVCAAIRQHDIGCFYIWGGSALIWDKLRCFVRSYSGISKIVKDTPKPFIYRVGPNCRLTQVRLP